MMSEMKQQRNNTFATTYRSPSSNRVANNNRNRSLSSNALMSREKSSVVRKSIPTTTITTTTGTTTNASTEKQQQLGRLHFPDNSSNMCDSNCPIQKRGYVRGNFTSGQIHNLHLRNSGGDDDNDDDTKCYCHSYNYYGTILVVGTNKSIDFYETNNYSIITSIAHTTIGGSGMVSAIVWVAPPNTNVTIATTSIQQQCSDAGGNYYRSGNDYIHHQILAISDLNGRIYLYSIDPDILESQGPTLFYSGTTNHHSNCTNHSQIRSLAAGMWYTNNNNNNICDSDANSDIVLFVAAGDKSGCITIMTFDIVTTPTSILPVYRTTKQFNICTQYQRQPHDSGEMESDKKNTGYCGILGIALELKRGMMAVCTSNGLVQVHSIEAILKHDHDHHHHQFTANYGQQIIWSTQNTNGSAIRCIVFAGPISNSSINNNDNRTLLLYGGYDKTICMVDIEQRPWTMIRELCVQGTVNTIQYDKQYRYIGVGCRDKTFTIFDTSTFVAIRVFHTPSWVTSISWNSSSDNNDSNNIVAIRSESNCITVMDLSPIQSTNIFDISSGKQHGSTTENSGSLSWSCSGQYLAYTTGSRIVIVDSHEQDINKRQFREVTSYNTRSGSSAIKAVFCQASDKTDLISAIDDEGWLYVLRFHASLSLLELVSDVFIESNLKALAWSPDGEILLVGGRKKLLHVLIADSLERKIDPVAFHGRIWDIDFVPPCVGSKTLYFGVALGDYTTVVMDRAMEPVLEISRTLTCRCLKFHPYTPILAIGDGAGSVAVIDCEDGEVLAELDLHERVTAIAFSPAGDYLVVGTDECRFAMYESTNYRLLQDFPSDSRALSASFSTNGLYLALGSTDMSYNIIRLGPFLGTEFIPMNLAGGMTSLPESELKQVLFHSGEGPSLLQRHMVRGGPDNLRRVAAILHVHPSAVYTHNRCTGEGCFDTALRLQKPGLLKLFLVSLVDGTLNCTDGKHRTFLATSIPQRGRDVLTEIVKNYPSDFIIDILSSVTFMKVPHGHPRSVESGDLTECGSTTYRDPWPVEVSHERMQMEKSVKSTRYFSCGGSIRTPAILPLPGLGNMDLLANLLVSAPAEAFDNDAMALVLRVLWKNYVRRYYYFDFCLFVTYYLCWIVLVETATISSQSGPILMKNVSASTILVPIVVLFNTLFAAKEIVEGMYGMKFMYWRSMWNASDWLGIVSVYSYTINVLCTGDHLVPLAVGTTLCLTIKLLSYLRGFSSTGWLLSVLSANFHDVQGFLVIVTTILIGFGVAFRLLFAETGDEAFGSLRRSLLSTFELTVMGSYDTMILFETQYTVIAVITFIMAVTCIVVVVLNALISILSDSYAKVQEHAVANRRREIASLIVEYMTLLPRWRRQQIEKETTWFHTLLEVDADGSLQVHSDDWEGGLNALRHDMEEMGRLSQQSHERAVERLKTDLDTDLTKFKKEVLTMLEGLTDDVKYLRKMQSQNILNFDGHHIKKAVRAVKSVGRKSGEALFNKDIIP